MKKLMIMAVVVGLGFAAQAETSYTFTYTVYNLDSKYNGYKIDMFYNYPDELSNLDNLVISVFNNDMLSDTYWSDEGADSWSSYYASISEGFSLGTVVDGSGTVSLIYVYDEELSYAGYNCYSAVCTLYKDGITPDSEYVLFETVYYNEPSEPNTLNPTFDMTGAQVIKSGRLMKDAVPEPTSGLLMLLGMAGLALKRRKA